MHHRTAPGWSGLRTGRCRQVRFYRPAKALGGLYMRSALGLRVLQAELVPTAGPLIVCSNHIHWMDPLLLACASPRPIFFMAKQELFANRLFATVFDGLGAFPVRRGTIDRAAVRRCLDLLRDGQAVGIFPEGTRSRTGRLGPGEPGASVIGLTTGALIVPAGVAGYRGRRELRVVWGQPFDPRDFGPPEARRDRQVVAALTGAIMTRIAELSDQEPPTQEPESEAPVDGRSAGEGG